VKNLQISRSGIDVLKVRTLWPLSFFSFLLATETVSSGKMGNFKFFDYVVGAFGIIGALQIFGVFGKFLSVLQILFLFTSIGIVAYCSVDLILKWLADELTVTEHRVGLFYIITNSLPILAIYGKHVCRGVWCQAFIGQ